MKNPVFIALVWLVLFLIEILFSWQVGGLSFKPWGSLFVLGYAFFALPLRPAVIFALFSLIIQCGFTSEPHAFLFLIFTLSLGVFWVRRKTFSGNLAVRAIAVAVVLGLDFYILEFFQGSLIGFSSFLFWGGFLIQFGINLILGVGLFWLLEEQGALWEERLLAFQAKKGQLHLFEARHLRPARRKNTFKVQRRIRRRFGLRDSW